MKVLGLTGSIGMGKSTVAAMAARCGIPVFDADKTVHAALKAGGKAVASIARLFPHSYRDGAIDRAILGRAVFGDPAKLRQVESVLHPLVRQERAAFLALQRRRRM